MLNRVSSVAYSQGGTTDQLGDASFSAKAPEWMRAD
jgi:hypothetical protein